MPSCRSSHAPYASASLTTHPPSPPPAVRWMSASSSPSSMAGWWPVSMRPTSTALHPFSTASMRALAMFATAMTVIS